MANAEKRLEQMRNNPLDWRIEDIVTVCSGFGIECTPPQNGSHYKVKHPAMVEILTIPSHKPIKPIYVRHLVKFIDAVRGMKP
jgi:HicA toxin of bacterial toxin-antitoxin,